jgi:hypothetical protein
LLPFLPRHWRIWECACGEGNLVAGLREEGYEVVGTDILGGFDYLMWEPEVWDAAVTNPPYHWKQQFLERAYLLGKPFAFLLPLTTFETRRRQQLFRDYGVEVIFFPERVNFETPSRGPSAAWFAVAWFTWGLGIGRQMTFWEG